MSSHGYGEQEDRDWDMVYEMAHKEFNKLQAEHRTAIIEECACIAEDHHGAIGDSIAADIRALKNPPPENRHGEGEF